MKSQKRKLPKWVICLIVTVVSVIVSCLMMILSEEVLHLDINNVPRFIDKLFAFLIYAPLCVFMLGFSAMIVYIIKGITARRTSRYVPPDVSAGADRNDAGEDRIRPQKIDPHKLYDSDHVMQFGDDAKPMTWLFVGMFLLLFLPAGIFFAIRKLLEEKSRYYDNGIRLIVFGAALMILTIPLLFPFYSQDSFEMISLTFLCPFVLGLVMILFGFVFRHKGKINNDYMVLLKIDRITQMDEIARIMKTDYPHAADVIQGLIDNDLLLGAYIFHKDREVILPGISEKIALKCPFCGATTVLYKTDNHTCMYCGAKI